jgi:hypothetical protein
MKRSIALVLASCVVLLAAGIGYYLFASDDAAAPSPPDAAFEKPRPPRPLLPPIGPPPLIASPRPAGLDASHSADAQSPEEAAGPERKAPANLPPQFSEPEMRAAVATALKEAGARGAAITNTDCTEHPCIIYVENVSPYDSKKIVQAPALGPYRKTSGFTACFPTARTDGTGVGVCGYSWEPKIESPQEREAALKRLKYRVEQMRDATK